MRRFAIVLAILFGAGGVTAAGPATPPSSAASVTADDLRATLAAERRQARALRRELLRERRKASRIAARAGVEGQVDEALRLAAAVYGVPLAELERVAWCESRRRPWARNASGASGLLQFMPGTYAGTPPGRAGLSIFSPYANALAAGWLVSRAGWRPWSCRP